MNSLPCLKTGGMRLLIPLFELTAEGSIMAWQNPSTRISQHLRMPDLLYDLASAKESIKTFKRKLKNYGKYDLLIIDDFLITELSENQQSDLFELLELRSENYSTILSSQFLSSAWHERLGSGAIADAIMDRTIHNSYIINIKGDKSMREVTSRTK